MYATNKPVLGSLKACQWQVRILAILLVGAHNVILRLNTWTVESEYPTDDIRRTLFRTKEGKVSVLSWHTVFDVEETITVESNRVSMGSI